MNKKLLKQLILISYKNGEMDNAVISRIAGKLTRSQLKIYIRALKNAEKLQNVYVDTSFPVTPEVSKELGTIFHDKKIIFRKNPSLIMGTQISSNDDVFDLSLKNSLDTIIESIENYD